MRTTSYLLLSVLLLIGCSQTGRSSSLPMTNQTGLRPATSSSFATIYSFVKSKDGTVPVGALLSLNGVLYGTTNFGGRTSSVCYPGNGCGVVYELTDSGVETPIYAFTGKTGGARPYAGVIAIDNTLYGATQNGGAHNKGAVFAVTPSGTETNLHSFKGKDGEDARAGLVAVNDTLYGTTYYGGSSRTGTVFSITTAGAEKVLHNFIGGNDGALPLSQLIAVGTSPVVLYGTTSGGGANNVGTVFSINVNGSGYTRMHSFGSGSDGSSPFAGLVDYKGTLYGTTELGGKYNKGTVFSITYGGTETVLHSFGGKGDGQKPYSSLTVLNGTLYGTTAYGGNHKEGTIFEITPSGTETVLHDFTGGAGGRVPYTNMTPVGNALYGVTIWGGPKNIGTAYVYTP